MCIEYLVERCADRNKGTLESMTYVAILNKVHYPADLKKKVKINTKKCEFI